MRWKCMSVSRCDTFLLLTQQTIRVAASGRHGGRSQLSARSRETGNRKQETGSEERAAQVQGRVPNW